MTQDRVGGDQFLLTQEFLARMVGVHRPRVSIIAATLQEAGLIRYHRGLMTIDRSSLQHTACGDYLVTRVMYEELYATANKQRHSKSLGRDSMARGAGQSKSVRKAVAAQVA
jgi:hypothetical protein